MSLANPPDKTFAFKFGISFGQFSATQNSENYISVQNVLPLDLRSNLPAYEELKTTLWWDFDPRRSFFDGAMELYDHFQIGLLIYLRFLLSLPGHLDPKMKETHIKNTELRLIEIFTSFGYNTDVVDKFLENLKLDQNSALESFVFEFRKFVLDSENSEQSNDTGNPFGVEFPYALLPFEDDVMKALETTVGEARICYNNECRLACIILCGRIIETVMQNAYWKEFGEYPQTKKGHPMGFAAIRGALKEKGLLIDERIDMQLELIYHHRNSAVHKSTTVPTEDLSKGIGLLTRDIVRITAQFYEDRSKCEFDNP